MTLRLSPFGVVLIVSAAIAAIFEPNVAGKICGAVILAAMLQTVLDGIEKRTAKEPTRD